MTDKEKIAEVICRVTHKTLLAHCDVQCNVMCMQYAEELVKQGYHKTVWHKVADGDLPKRENEDVCAIPVQAHYIDSNGMKGNGPLYFFSIDNTFHTLGGPKAINVIAWTQLPKYKEVE